MEKFFDEIENNCKYGTRNVLNQNITWDLSSVKEKIVLPCLTKEQLLEYIALSDQEKLVILNTCTKKLIAEAEQLFAQISKKSNDV